MTAYSREEIIAKLKATFPNVEYELREAGESLIHMIWVSERPRSPHGWHRGKFACISVLASEGEECWRVDDWDEFIADGLSRYGDSITSSGEVAR